MDETEWGDHAVDACTCPSCAGRGTVGEADQEWCPYCDGLGAVPCATPAPKEER